LVVGVPIGVVIAESVSRCRLENRALSRCDRLHPANQSRPVRSNFVRARLLVVSEPMGVDWRQKLLRET
jgi:hypothetical protein